MSRQSPASPTPSPAACELTPGSGQVSESGSRIPAPASKLAGDPVRAIAHLSDDEAVAKMGHPRNAPFTLQPHDG